MTQDNPSKPVLLDGDRVFPSLLLALRAVDLHRTLTGLEGIRVSSHLETTPVLRAEVLVLVVVTRTGDLQVVPEAHVGQVARTDEELDVTIRDVLVQNVDRANHLLARNDVGTEERADGLLEVGHRRVDVFGLGHN